MSGEKHGGIPADEHFAVAIEMDEIGFEPAGYIEEALAGTRHIPAFGIHPFKHIVGGQNLDARPARNRGKLVLMGGRAKRHQEDIVAVFGQRPCERRRIAPHPADSIRGHQNARVSP